MRLEGRADAVVGGAPTLAGIIEVKSGALSQEQRDELSFYGLLLALRDGRAWPPPSSSPRRRSTSTSAVPTVCAPRAWLTAAIVAAGEPAGGSHAPELARGRCERCPDRRRCPTART